MKQRNGKFFNVERESTGTQIYVNKRKKSLQTIPIFKLN